MKVKLLLGCAMVAVAVCWPAPVNAQGSNPNSLTPGAGGTGTIGGPSLGGTSVASFGQSSPLRPVRPWYPRHTIQNPSNPWLPPNLTQVNTTLNPVGTISPTGTLTQPTSVLNTPNTVQQAGFPTVPNYNIGTPTPTTQSFAQVLAPSISPGSNIASPSNPGNQNVGASSAANPTASFPTNPLFP
jgi:hypothetical protein